MNGNLAHPNTLADFDAVAPNPSSANNWAGDLTGVPHGGVNSTSLANIKFVSTTFPEDLHIGRTSTLVDFGVAIAAVIDDIDGGPRGTPDIGADEADTSSANPVKILTAKSAFELVQLEWQHPDFGPMDFVEVVRSPTAFPLLTSGGTVTCSYLTPAPGTKGQCADTLPRVNGTPYYYSAFVYDFGGNYSKEASVIGKPFDTGAVPPEWTYATRAATLESAGVRGSNAFVASNDNFFHAMQGGSGATAGEWPLSAWAPYELPAAVQHRPVIVNIVANPTALLGAQDGRVYAVDIGTGRLVWKSQVLGGSIDAAPAALVAAWGATGGGADRVFVGTSDPASTLFVLDLMTGDVVNLFDDGGLPSNIGPITGVAVKYPSGPVFFTSDDGSGGANRNVWSIDVSVLPATPTEIWSDNPGPIDAGPTLYQSLLIVGSRAGDLIGYNDVGPAPPLWTHSLGNGPLKAPIFPVFSYDTLLVSTDDEVFSVQFTATGGCGTPPCTNWTQSLGAAASPVLFIPGTSNVFVGAGDGTFWEFTINLGAPAISPAVRSWSISPPSGLGGPAFSISQLTLYVSDTSGKVHGIPWPIP